MKTTRLVTAVKQGLLCTALVFSISQVSWAQNWKINLQDADIKAFITEVADITGKNFVLDPRINGQVTVISNKPLNEQEIYNLFLGVLDVNGVKAITSGNVIKLVPDNVVKQSGIEVDLTNQSVGEQMQTRVVTLNNMPAAELLPVIRPLMPQYANVAIVPSANALVLSDKADSLNQLTRLINSLDGGGADTLEVIPLRYTTADAVAETLNSLTGIGSQTQSNTSSTRLKVIADNSNNRILVMGSPQAQDRIYELVSRLDTKPVQRLGGLKVFSLKYASATHIADMLQALLSNQSISSQGAQTTLQATSMLSGNTNNVTNTATANKTPGNTSAGNGNAASKQSQTKSLDSQRPFSIIADETQNALIVNAAPELMMEIQDTIEQLDQRRDQVLIQAAIIEVSGDSLEQLGVQWALGDGNYGVGAVNFNNAGVPLSSIAGAAYGLSSGLGAASALGVANNIAGGLFGAGSKRTNSRGDTEFYGAIIQALKNTTNANVLSMPSIMTLDNEQASILVGQNVPFVTGQYTNGSTSGVNPFQTIDRQDVGINLNVIPHIGENGTIRLEVSQEVSSVSDSSASNNLVTNKRMIKTTILADNGQTIALGGLMENTANQSNSKVPILGDLPGIGALFRSKSNTDNKTNLLIFLQPRILRDATAVAALTDARYNNIRVMQLSMDKAGNLNKLPLDVNRLYQQPAWQVSADGKAVASTSPVDDVDIVNPIVIQPDSTRRNSQIIMDSQPADPDLQIIIDNDP